MEVKRLKSENHLDRESGCRYRLVKSETESFVLHCHEYYEIFLTLRGKAIHYVNGTAENVCGGYLIFIRKDDMHDYQNYDGAFEIVNLAFTEETMQSLFSYLGEGFPAEKLLSSTLPPMVKLSASETQGLYLKLAELNTVKSEEKALLKMKCRALLAEIFTKYFCVPSKENDHIPFWLKNAHEKMKNPENFIVGKKRFFELSGVSRAHATRLLSKHYGVTPSDYVNDLRLSYAANLFISSNLNATEICYECGFQNVSWFYSMFKEKYGVTPANFRKSLDKK